MENNVADMNYHLPQGFRYAGVRCGIKNNAEALDLSLVVSDVPSVGCGVYTQNQVVAAPVLACRERTPSAKVRGVVVNSGNANACTGQQGRADAQEMCALAARACGEHVGDRELLVLSTGIIGRPLPMNHIRAGIEQAGSVLDTSQAAFLRAADGFLTTDVSRKVATRSIRLNDVEVRMAGIAKGAGMIGPNMATMLGCVVTDAKLGVEQAERLLQCSTNRSFNNISVEGHTSTNDTVLLLANAQSGAEELCEAHEHLFADALDSLCIELAKQIPTDGEGASHLIEVEIRGAASNSDADCIARSVAGSNLVKTAIYGNDPNWGRIVSAAGYAGPKLDSGKLQLTLNGILLFDEGEAVPFDAPVASQSIRDNPTALIQLVVGTGPGECTHWTSDLSVEYVRFNSEYTT